VVRSLALLGHEAGRVRLEPLGEPIISAVAAISKFSGLESSLASLAMSVSRIWRRVLAQMSGDPIGAGGHREKGGAHGVGQGATARVPHGRDMVDVHAQAQAVLGHRRPPLSLAPLRRVRHGFKARDVIGVVSILDRINARIACYLR
jgi:hypothetical protein